MQLRAMDAEALLYRAPTSVGVWEYTCDTTEPLMWLTGGGVLSISLFSEW